MGKIVSFGDSLIITVFSMVVVFVVLITISYLIDVLRITTNGKKNKEKSNELNLAEVKQTIEDKKVETEKNMDEEELVAVIAAAVAASLGVTIPEINIKSIKRVSGSNSSWAEMGRREQISGRL